MWTLLNSGGGGFTPAPGVKNSTLRSYVVAVGSDGYQAVIAGGEINPKFGNQPTMMAYADTGGQLVQPAPRALRAWSCRVTRRGAVCLECGDPACRSRAIIARNGWWPVQSVHAVRRRHDTRNLHPRTPDVVSGDYVDNNISVRHHIRHRHVHRRLALDIADLGGNCRIHPPNIVGDIEMPSTPGCDQAAALSAAARQFHGSRSCRCGADDR